MSSSTRNIVLIIIIHCTVLVNAVRANDRAVLLPNEHAYSVGVDINFDMYQNYKSLEVLPVRFNCNLFKHVNSKNLLGTSLGCQFKGPYEYKEANLGLMYRHYFYQEKQSPYLEFKLQGAYVSRKVQISNNYDFRQKITDRYFTSRGVFALGYRFVENTKWSADASYNLGIGGENALYDSFNNKFTGHQYVTRQIKLVLIQYFKVGVNYYF